MKDLLAKARTLTEALPWIKATWGDVVVVKYGGAAMADPELREMVASDIVLMKLVGMNPVIVHGGGPNITSLMERLGMPVEFHDGMRVTDDAAMEVVKMVLVGKVNTELVSAINRHGRLAVGISGDDGNLIEARPISEELGRVGEVTAIDTTVLDRPDRRRFHPGRRHGRSWRGRRRPQRQRRPGRGRARGGPRRGQGHLPHRRRRALRRLARPEHAHQRAQPSADGGSHRERQLEQRDDPENRGVRAGAARRGASGRTSSTGRVPHALLLEVYTDEGVGTMITAEGAPPAGSGGEGPASDAAGLGA